MRAVISQQAAPHCSSLSQGEKRCSSDEECSSQDSSSGGRTKDMQKLIRCFYDVKQVMKLLRANQFLYLLQVRLQLTRICGGSRNAVQATRDVGRHFQ